jgi:selenocysteine-specific elongation factor
MSVPLSDARHLVVGTAGHIDHGKSALVKALTGTDPDRLREEKLRGITIDLGFADMDLGGDRVVSFVDVPGHERFVRHMVAGATGIDAVLLVVAADEGVKPQTREHLEICQLLGIGHGLVAVTKVDLVDADLVGVVVMEIREEIVGTFLERAPVALVSARSGEGLDQLRASLGSLFAAVPERSAEGPPRLPIDRSFVLRGFGTVVTGTLVSGRLREGDEVEIVPGGARGRIRGLQIHRRRASEAPAGRRVAVNLQGLDRWSAPRGATLTTPGALLTTRRLWARVALLPQRSEGLRRGGRVRFHQGTCERDARLRLLGDAGGGLLHAELRLDAETVLLPGDRFVLRRPAPVDTVGGGAVTDIRPPAVRGEAATREALVSGGNPLVERLSRAGAGGRAPALLAAELGLDGPALEREAGELEAAGAVVQAGGLLFDGTAWRVLEGRLEEALSEFHRSEPLRRGPSREDLRGRIGGGMPQEGWRAMLESLAARGRVRLEGDRVALAGHRVILSPAEADLMGRIERRARVAWLDPLGADALLNEGPGDRASKLVELLLAEGRLVRLRDGRLIHQDALEWLRGKLRDQARISRTIDVAAFKRMTGLTRKNAIPLLEQMDAERRTRRVGDTREILDA